MMKYKGYYGTVQYDDEARIFSGEVLNTRTVITFQGTTVDEIETALSNRWRIIWNGVSSAARNRKNRFQENLCYGFPRNCITN